MTADEREFAALVDALDTAQTKFNYAVNSLGGEPDYERDFHRSTRHTPAEMSAYKKQLAIYEEGKQKQEEAAAEVADAASALDAWIPQVVHERLKVGVGILAPMLVGFISIRKPAGQYILVKGKTKEETERNVESYIARMGFGI